MFRVLFYVFVVFPFLQKKGVVARRRRLGFDISPRLSLVCVCFVFVFLFCFLPYPCKNEAQKKDAQETKMCEDLSEARVDSFLM